MAPIKSIAESLAVSAELKRSLNEAVKGLKIDKVETLDAYLGEVETEAASTDPNAVRFAAAKLGVLKGLLGKVGTDLQARVDGLESKKEFERAKWAAEHEPTEDHAPLDKSIEAIDAEIKDLRMRLGKLGSHAEKLTELQRGFLGRLGSLADGGAARATQAEELRKAAVAQAQRLRGANLQNAALHAQVASAQALAADAIDPVGGPGRPARNQMKRASIPETPDTALWFKIRRATLDLSWEKYSRFIEGVMCADPATGQAKTGELEKSKISLPFPDIDPYRFLKAATEVFMMVHCDTFEEVLPPPGGLELDADLDYGERRLGWRYTPDQIEAAWLAYLAPDAGASPGTPSMLPYLALIRSKLQDVPLVGDADGKDYSRATGACAGILRRKLTSPCLLELIWSYWHEEGMLVQSMNAVTRRFQNVRTPGDRDPLATLEIDPLRPLGNVLWGYIQDEQHRLTVLRRAYEYDHHYGLKLVGKAVQGLTGADSRTRFLEAFHGLLNLCTIFYKEDDDTTVIADGFPILNALRDVHVLLSQGAHNQYGDLPWTARQEMLMQQWILARPEFREFLPTRIMVAYPEKWMDRVDAVKSLMGWTDASVLHFRELAIYGERILLGARFNHWTEIDEPEAAANWARFWRPDVQGYIHAYRAVTGVDLAERAEATMPSALLRTRLAAQRVLAR